MAPAAEPLAALARAADVNLAHAWAVMGGHARFDVGAIGGVTLVASGVPLEFYNAAVAAAASDDPERTVAGIASFFAGRGVPALMWVREGVDDELVAAARRAGFTETTSRPAMGLLSLSPVPAEFDLPGELHVEIVAGRDAIDEFRDVLAAGFGFALDVAYRVLASTLRTDPEAALLIGRVGDVAVSTAALITSGDTAGIHNVATRPDHRRRGYGAALTAAAIAEGRARGATHAVLQASPDGEPVYRRMGFVDLGRYVRLRPAPGPADPDR
jgi:ribosomal protein S18 acetylase RimI-like enzyme